MKIAQVKLNKLSFTPEDLAALKELQPHLITVFGGVEFFADLQLGKRLKDVFPSAHLIGCSTAGEISEQGVSDNTLIITGVQFKKPSLKSFCVPFRGLNDSEFAGQKLAQNLRAPDLNGVFILGQGVDINGSTVISGLKSKIPSNVVITGGLAADGGAFKKTYVLSNETVSSEIIAGLGLYGKSLKLNYGSVGGWEPFGKVRKVTKSKGNLLYELDGEPALMVYKKYLGDHAKQLPASGLLFPFEVLKNAEDNSGIIRTLLAVNEKDGSLTLAGDVPQNSLVRLMHTRSSGLVQGAEQAALRAGGSPSTNSDFSILVSCVGRKLVMGPNVDEEVDAVKAILKHSLVAGFYSNGEICPSGVVENCKLHNQTMTITRISEAA